MALDRLAFAEFVLRVSMRGMERRTLCACMALADDDGIFPLKVEVLAPMSGNRRPYVHAALEVLSVHGWVESVGQGKAQLKIPSEEQED